MSIMDHICSLQLSVYCTPQMLQVLFFWCCPLNANASTTSPLRGAEFKMRMSLVSLQFTANRWHLWQTNFSPAFILLKNPLQATLLCWALPCPQVLSSTSTDNESGTRKPLTNTYARTQHTFDPELLAQFPNNNNNECGTVILVMLLKCKSW
jgi:hypothetical protein